MVFDRDGFADVVAERRDDHLFAGAVALGARRRLQAVDELIDGEAVYLRLQLREHCLDDLRHGRLSLADGLRDPHPVFDLSFIHSGKRHSGGLHKPGM